MSDFFNLLKTIYLKDKLEITDDLGSCIALTKVLSKDAENLKELRDILPFLFYISPRRFFYLLFFKIKKRSYIPKSLKIEKIEESKTELMEKIQKVLTWSNRDFNYNKKILEHHILSDEKYWKGELGI